jgi:hypothetical protein
MFFVSWGVQGWWMNTVSLYLSAMNTLWKNKHKEVILIQLIVPMQLQFETISIQWVASFQPPRNSICILTPVKSCKTWKLKTVSKISRHRFPHNHEEGRVWCYWKWHLIMAGQWRQWSRLSNFKPRNNRKCSAGEGRRRRCHWRRIGFILS